MELIDAFDTDFAGRICYYITGKNPYGVRIEQERGILKVSEAENLSHDYERVKKFVKSLAKNKATAISLYGLCDDFSDT